MIKKLKIFVKKKSRLYLLSI